MNKKLLILTIFILYTFTLFATEIKIAPFAVYDSAGNKTNPPSSPSKAIYSKLEKHWFEGLINYDTLSENRHGIPLTVIDANRICTADNTDYLIYGYIKKNDTNWFAEVKLYASSEKKIIKSFFSSDDSEHYERMLSTLSDNILFGIEEITGINKEESKENSIRPMELRLPSSIYYWSPADRNWSNKILGLAGIKCGIEFYPPLPVTIWNEKLLDFSVRFNLLWDIGMNQKNVYPLVINTIEIEFPLLAHIHFNNQHSLYAGAGLAYGIELMSIQPKYENKHFLYQNNFSLENTFGYDFNLNELINLFAEITLNFHLSGDGFASIKSCLGVSFSLYKEAK